MTTGYQQPKTLIRPNELLWDNLQGIIDNQMGSAAEWHAFLDEFRGFGGKAENVMQRKGAFGLGLFPIDSSKPIELFVPDELLVKFDNVELQDGEVVIKDDSNFPVGYAEWFRKYQSCYSWGGEGRSNTLDLEEGLKALPDTAQVLLRRHGLYNSENRFPEKDREQELLQRFLQTRCINRKGQRVIMPMIELLNHSPSSDAYDMSGNGIKVSGVRDGEILVKYSISDPIRRLMAYGFNAAEPLGFSLSFQLTHQDKTIIIRGGGAKEAMKPCEIQITENRLIFQQPLLGSSTSPKMPRTLFIKACRTIDGIDANELFDQLHQRNTQILVQLLKILQDVEGNIAGLIRSGCLNQLAALSHHVGQRDDLLSQDNSK